MTLTDTALEYSLFDLVQEAAGTTQVLIIPIDGGLRHDENYMTLQLLDMDPEGLAETLWSDGDGQFAIKQYYSVRFSLKSFGTESKSRLATVLTKLFRDPYYTEQLASKCLGPLGNPEIIDDTELLTTKFESRSMARVTFLTPVVVLSSISCIEHITVGGSWYDVDGTLISSSDIQVDKA